MATYKTPGVYVEEISIFPPSVAEVETAIPAFIGYTEKAERKGESLRNKPTKIASLLEYQAYYGGAHAITQIDVVVDTSNNYAVEELTIPKRFYMYDALRLFFDNGGGECYIVSVGDFAATINNGDVTDPASSPGLMVGLDALKKYDEPTIILFPDAVLLGTEGELYSLQQKALSQCATLQDRVCVFDLMEGQLGWDDSISGFRNGIGINNLKYGAAYAPWLLSAYVKDVDFSLFDGHVVDTTTPLPNPVPLEAMTSNTTFNNLVVDAQTTLGDKATIATDLTPFRAPTLEDRYKSLSDAIDTEADAGADFAALLAHVRELALVFAGWNTSILGDNLGNDLDAYAESRLKTAVADLIALEREVVANNATFTTLPDDATVSSDYAAFDATGWLAGTVVSIVANGAGYAGASDLETAGNIEAALAPLHDALVAFAADVTEAAATHGRLTQSVLYDQHPIVGNIVNHIKRELAKTPPSGAIAGIYSYVDNTRGVHKAPANVSVSVVNGVTQMIDDAEQEGLNVDTTSGKSINAIRTFTGKGTLVWGARTLAGNDNEWRYVPVRRFFNMVEESVKKATSFAVFEPNDANLWTKVKGMIDNYLLQKWQEGALAGARPDDAFFVKVGLGQTMTAQDILEGRLIVEIGMAVVRPAEFIILRFSHKLQQS